MTTQFPHLSTCLDIKQSKHYPDKVGMMDRRTIRTRDCVAGILLLSDLCKDNPDFEGKLFGRIATHREDIVSGIDFRIYSGTGHLMDIDFTMDRSRFLGKVGHKKPSDTKKIALIDGTILL